MLKRVISIVLALVVLSVIIGCASGSKVSNVDPRIAKMENRIQNLKEKYIAKGGIAAIGMGVSVRRDLAREKAISNAQGLLSENYKAKISRLRKSFVEELGTNDTELNESFMLVTKSVASKVIRGAMVRKTDYLVENGKYTAYVVYAIDPKVLNQSILDEAKTKKKLYERFRASKAFKELNEEEKKFEEFEKKQQEQY